MSSQPSLSLSLDKERDAGNESENGWVSSKVFERIHWGMKRGREGGGGGAEVGVEDFMFQTWVVTSLLAIIPILLPFIPYDATLFLAETFELLIKAFSKCGDEDCMTDIKKILPEMKACDVGEWAATSATLDKNKEPSWVMHHVIKSHDEYHRRICSLISPRCIEAWSRGSRKSRSLAVLQLNQAPWFLDITRFWFYASAAWFFFWPG